MDSVFPWSMGNDEIVAKVHKENGTEKPEDNIYESLIFCCGIGEAEGHV